MKLSEPQIGIVKQSVRIEDVSGAVPRLTAIAESGAIDPSVFAVELADGLKNLKPVMVVIDPAVSFGTSEARINDNEQALIEAGRRIRNALNCCIRFIHHTGKGNAREANTDQYSGRGGAAFADGARMVHVLQPMDGGAGGLRLARPKMSYVPPQDDLLLVRNGFTFSLVTPKESDPLAHLNRDAATLWEIVRKLDQPPQNTLEAADTGLSRGRLRQVVKHLLDTGSLDYKEDKKPGGPQRYLSCADPTGAPAPIIHDSTGSHATGKKTSSCAAAYRESDGGAPGEPSEINA